MMFSVVIPSFNQGNYLKQTIASIYQQSDVVFDCYVADGGSQDQTIDILQASADQYPNFRWHSGPDLGQADAVNQAITVTTGEIIAWINSDDIYYPGAFATVAQIFTTNPNVLVVYGLANYIDANNQIIEPYPTQAWNYEALKDICYLCQPAVFFRRTCIEQWGNLNTDLHFCLDYELWLRWGKETKFYYLPKVLAGSRQYSLNKTIGSRVKAHGEVNQMLKQKLGYVPDRHLINYARVQTESQLNLDLSASHQLLHNRPVPKFDLRFWCILIFFILQQYWDWHQFPSLFKVWVLIRLKSKL
ncbi:glycosyltransferase family 2 protein [Thermosynechococcaceae cyanobacterium BACA0444]|uniref:Glycosyltransferase family 2 protein n=1 Tax=Pseudocalidococcus azoricus BACA0444 TaxID=2918990 RepID=A0AAE4JX00_9CYAN|nr:glycosyltransferase family 2 protein [Pseudocalidococcus azoricus]MDS3861945.1 glycosyltransferase family 2 protein [Pseudocalidococcus azoricus BACA0444]